MNYQFGPFTNITVLSNGTLRIFNSITNEIVEVQPEVLEDIITMAFLNKEKVSKLLEKSMRLQEKFNKVG